ncbi:Activator of Hsp90 ATPase 1 family protein [Kribbella flavida DSM 17836]|uniref:Activator of Hsp90 ATPase 1 family protein n=1 Tax=Kribbella flavida (strain DSM 17836 / JCM 10339 / NBRC 14399) TaxID=479435 RepID=D2PTH4_KRIFD|nr:SRPBCC family protein [Kribbella flavida]ADB31287.1 Activator of Hsp90 ATPase 1 family protein [Kribbella flavida DSM 17836]
MDILEHITAVQREVTRTGETASVLMRRSYQAEIEDVWDALTDPERMARWFSPVTGELKVGGTFQIQGNAGGEIIECEPPKRYKVTFGGPTSLLEVRLTPGPGETTEFELEHSMEGPPAPGGAGALYVGPGWDGAILGLGLYLAGELTTDDDPTEMANSPEVVRYNEQSIYAWIDVIRASGTTSEQDLKATIEIAMAQYVPGKTPPE